MNNEPKPGEVLHEEKHDSSSAFISAGGKLLNDDLIDEVFDKRK